MIGVIGNIELHNLTIPFYSIGVHDISGPYTGILDPLLGIQSHLIASGDWGMDENGATHAEMNPVQSSNKTQWHAFGHSDKRFRELWLRSTSEPDLELRLVKLGPSIQLLHNRKSDLEVVVGFRLKASEDFARYFSTHQ
jgi:hypothetical protein